MMAHTLFSDAQTQLVARVLNNSSRDKSLSMNSFLSLAEPVQCLSGTESEPTSLMFASSSDCCDSKSSDESTLPASSSPLSDLMLTEETELLASSVSSQTVDATDSDSSPSSSCYTACLLTLPLSKGSVPRPLSAVTRMYFLALSMT